MLFISEIHPSASEPSKPNHPPAAALPLGGLPGSPARFAWLLPAAPAACRMARGVQKKARARGRGHINGRETP